MATIREVRVRTLGELIEAVMPRPDLSREGKKRPVPLTGRASAMDGSLYLPRTHMGAFSPTLSRYPFIAAPPEPPRISRLFRDPSTV